MTNWLTIPLAALTLAACAEVDTAPKPANPCTAYTRGAYINTAMKARHMTTEAATAERDALCGVGL